MTEKRKDKKQFTCIICPNSCRLSAWIDENTNEVDVEGYSCPRGKDYGIKEYTNPVRMVITTMRVENAMLPVIPVRSTKEIPKGMLFDAIKIINQTSCKTPIKMGQILITNIAATGVDIIASRDME